MVVVLIAFSINIGNEAGSASAESGQLAGEIAVRAGFVAGLLYFAFTGHRGKLSQSVLIERKMEEFAREGLEIDEHEAALAVRYNVSAKEHLDAIKSRDGHEGK